MKQKPTIRTYLNRLRWLAYNLLIKGILFNVSFKVHAGEKAVYFQLKDNTAHRYFMNLCHFLTELGYDVIVKPTAGFLGHWQTREFIRQLPHVKYALRCTGYPVSISDYKTSSQSKTLRYDYYAFIPGSESYRVPMCMVDTMYYFRFYQKAPDYADNAARTIAVFYAGNLSESYRNETINRKFRLMDRVAVIDTLKSGFPGSADVANVKEVLSGKKGRDVLILNRQSNPVLPVDLLRVLSLCSFILVPPGVVMPQTHFIVEGMSVGCIPILQYRDMFYPPLEHMKNCLYFNDAEDLKRVVRGAMEMNKSDIVKMREEVVCYYSERLSPRAVVERIVDPAIKYIYLNAESVSVDLM